MSKKRGIPQKFWLNRMRDRVDLSISIVHLTRSITGEEGTAKGVLDPLFSILDGLRINPSLPNKGFINGTRPATCFQDAPLVGLGQNIMAEQKYREARRDNNHRYNAAGLMFSKMYAFSKGARPVIYEQAEVARNFLPPEEYWRIVDFDLSDSRAIVDWSHEREWRCPGAFEFDIQAASVVLPNPGVFQEFVKRCIKEENGYLEKLNGICQMRMTL